MTGPGDGPPPLAAFNALSAAECAALLAPVCEHAPDLTAPLAALRPFESVTALHAALERALAAAPEARILDFLNAHPELTAAHRAMRLTAESAGEQAAAGLDALAADAAARLAELNAAYRRRHGFPFILAVRHAGPATVLAGLAHRLERPTAVERAAALEEIGAIVWMRLLERVAPAPTGAIAVAATDRARGAPAAGAPAALWRIGEDGAETALDAGALDARGRRELLAGAAVTAGLYEIRIDAAAHFAATGRARAAARFLPEARARFRVLNPEARCDVEMTLGEASAGFERGA